ncbi:GAF domain-containing protein [Novosphingobium flavum]|uniref:GAF domain-containing protein n=1 Tax=Novosphingobium flavum TaxID=1778672 RepID=A0A7X1FND3_9SPHN|nr:GAF domain-containing protein [Novosphingobium flavum]MBC2663954.1 GAF domain-containing protein [Novosphingobium flavum]
MQGLLDTPCDQTFIRVAEVWIPDGDRLRLADGNYGALADFAEVSRTASFARGEGLPGKAWAEQRPVVLGDLDGGDFVRGAAAAEAGLTSAVAIPVFAGKQLKAVLVLMCGAGEGQSGGIEIWQDEDGRLVLADGCYGEAGDFAAVSRGMSFGHGQGLPGGVWSARMPVLMRDLGRAAAFLRSAAASAAGFKSGIGLPVPVPDGSHYVLTLLSSVKAPIARRFELWDTRVFRVGPGGRAELVDGICERQGNLAPVLNPPVDPVTVGLWEGPIGRVLGTGLPCVQEGPTALPEGYSQMIALPIYRETEMAYVAAWYL